MMTCVAHSTHGCALHAGCDGVRGGRIPEAGAGAAAVPGRPGQRAAAAGNHLRQPSVPGKIDCGGRLTQQGTPEEEDVPRQRAACCVRRRRRRRRTTLPLS